MHGSYEYDTYGKMGMIRHPLPPATTGIGFRFGDKNRQRVMLTLGDDGVLRLHAEKGVLQIQGEASNAFKIFIKERSG